MRYLSPVYTRPLILVGIQINLTTFVWVCVGSNQPTSGGDSDCVRSMANSEVFYMFVGVPLSANVCTNMVLLLQLLLPTTQKNLTQIQSDLTPPNKTTACYTPKIQESTEWAENNLERMSETEVRRMKLTNA